MPQFPFFTTQIYTFSMSDIKKEKTITITGTMEVEDVHKWHSCQFCHCTEFTATELMGEPVCTDCKEKIFTRIKLILDFQ